MSQNDSVVKVYERRPGKLLHDKTFRPKDECPSVAMVSADNEAKSCVLATDIEPWVRS